VNWPKQDIGSRCHPAGRTAKWPIHVYLNSIHFVDPVLLRAV
jgi:hypothetical protein